MSTSSIASSTASVPATPLKAARAPAPTDTPVVPKDAKAAVAKSTSVAAAPSSGRAALQGATKTTTQTANEARSGDQQVQRLQQRRSAHAAGSAGSAGLTPKANAVQAAYSSNTESGKVVNAKV
jgi:hypothetical protein